MITMKFALVFFTCAVISCIFFTLGRWVGSYDGMQIKSNAATKFENITENYINNRKYKNKPRENIIDAEYEDIIFDLEEFRQKKEKERDSMIEEITSFEWMYSKKDRQMVKVPFDVANLIKYLQKIKEQNL